MTAPNEAQIQAWNGRTGEKWAALQADLDVMLAPLTDELTARAGSVAGLRVLDVGCGTGETCAIWHEAGATVTGVDVSVPMLAVAAKRTGGKVTLLEADASVWRGDAPFDLVVSRLGVMFFDDPAAAFTNLAANLRPGGRLLFVCWRAREQNAWVTTPVNAIADLLPSAPPPPPGAPGPFGLADDARLRSVLERAGFKGVTIRSVDCALCLATDGVDAAVRFAMQTGPTGAALAETDKATRALAKDRLRAALAPHEVAGRVTLGAAIWVVEATRP